MNKKKISIKELLLDKYIQAIERDDYLGALEWRKQLRDHPWWQFWK